MKYNPYYSSQDINLSTLSKELFKNLTKKNIIKEALDSLHNTFKDPSPFKVMISFNKDIPYDKKHFECYFKIILNKEKYIRNY